MNIVFASNPGKYCFCPLATSNRLVYIWVSYTMLYIWLHAHTRTITKYKRCVFYYLVRYDTVPSFVIKGLKGSDIYNMMCTRFILAEYWLHTINNDLLSRCGGIFMLPPAKRYIPALYFCLQEKKDVLLERRN